MPEAYLEQNLQKTKKEIHKINSQLRHLPKGKLIVARSGNDHTKWFLSEPSKYTYIPKKQLDYAKKLALRKYLTAKKNELILTERYLSDCANKINQINKKSNQLKLDPRYTELFESNNDLEEELLAWANEPFESNPLFRENLIHNTLSGIKVRSKSEVIIADELWHRGIPFRYEAPLVLSDGIYYPDFTTRDPRNGATKYWEHLGMMNDLKYIQKNMRKIGIFSENDIIPTIDLILSAETESKPLDVSQVNKLIDLHFS